MAKARIITHGGKYHADELLAIAILAKFHETPVDSLNIKRVNHGENLDKYLKDANTYVLDTGRKFNPSMKNFDHHHDSNLPATCMIILKECYSGDLLKELSKFVEYVSNVDIGEGKSHFGDFNRTIHDMNTAGISFDEALRYVETTWHAVRLAAMFRVNIIKDLQSCVYDENYVINIFPYPLTGWEDNVPADTHFCIYKDTTTKEWGIIAKDSAVLPVYPVGEPRFIHNNKFIATFNTLAECIQTAQYSEQFLDSQPEPELSYE